MKDHVIRLIKPVFLLLLIALLLSISACGHGSVESRDAQDISGIAENTASSEAPCQETASNANSAPAIEYHSVVFYSNDGSIVQMGVVADGGALPPPSLPELAYGDVFEKWEHLAENVVTDLQIRPVFYPVKDKTNVFALPGIYAENGETVDIPLRLCGAVLLSGFDLTVDYDSAQLQLEDVPYEDDAVVLNAEEAGRIRINYVSVNNTSADVDICTLRFSVLAEEGEPCLRLEIKSICAWDEDEQLYSPEYQLLDGCVHILSKRTGQE